MAIIQGHRTSVISPIPPSGPTLCSLMRGSGPSGIAGTDGQRWARALTKVTPKETSSPAQKGQAADSPARGPRGPAAASLTISRGTWASGKASRSLVIHCRCSSAMRQSAQRKRATMKAAQAPSGVAQRAHGTADWPWKNPSVATGSLGANQVGTWDRNAVCQMRCTRDM